MTPKKTKKADIQCSMCGKTEKEEEKQQLYCLDCVKFEKNETLRKVEAIIENFHGLLPYYDKILLIKKIKTLKGEK